MINPIQEQILVEREGYAFLVEIEYEFLCSFCFACGVIGHLLSDCKKVMNLNKDVPKYDHKSGPKKPVQKYVSKRIAGKDFMEEAEKDIDVPELNRGKEATGDKDTIQPNLNKGKKVFNDISPQVMLQGDSSRQNLVFDNEQPISRNDLLQEIVDIPQLLMLLIIKMFGNLKFLTFSLMFLILKRMICFILM